MNAFKVLSRSTNLSRKRSTKSARKIPSSGEAFSPQLYRDEATNVAAVEALNEPSLINRKRKREVTGSSSSVDVPEELDFFKKEGKSSTEDSIVTVKQEKGDEFTETPESSDPPLSEEQCRQILKAHKLKITILPSAKLSHEISEFTKKTRQKAGEGLRSDIKRLKKEYKAVIPLPLLNFSQLRSRYHIARRLAENIDAQGYQIPTEVQLGTLPLLLDARESSAQHQEGEEYACGPNIDLLTVAPTGSGKTLAFLIPILNAILKQRKSEIANLTETERKRHFSGTQAVILAPTKELAAQIANEARKLALNTGVKVTLMRKGMIIVPLQEIPVTRKDSDTDEDVTNNAKLLERHDVVKAHVVVATPLSLANSLTRETGGIESIRSIRYLVLDEADVLLDPLFREQTLSIWQACSNPDLRVSLWSATMGASIEELAKTKIDERWQDLSEEHDLQLTERAELYRAIVGVKDSAIPNIEHKLIYAATEAGKLMSIRQMIHPTTSSSDAGPSLCPPFLVFTQTIPRAIALHSELIYDIPQEAGGSFRIAVLHSDLTDSARDELMKRFRKGEIWVLITTDLLSRGVDFKGINGVINYDFPNSSAAYVHRVGRTGRAGRDGGIAVTLYTKEDIPFLKSIANVIAISERQNKHDGKDVTVHDWLLEALPKASKKERQQLKKHGVEMRRTNTGKDKNDRTNRRARISTRSGYDRRLENRKRGAKSGNVFVDQGGHATRGQVPLDHDEFNGFDS